MRIRYLSDLHLEFIKPNKINKFIKKIPIGIDDEICVLAGDIGNPYQSNYDIFMNYISENFKKTFIIAGNHEYYNKTKTMQQTNEFMEEYFKKFNNITFLNNSYEIYNNFCFIGTTLWSKIINPQYEINDVHNIPNFTYIKYNELNELSIHFLENILQNNDNCVIISHHVPSDSLIDKKYKSENMISYNQWFYCDMDEFIETYKNKIKCWIYGHTHTPSNVTMNNIPFLCNPIGYPNENSRINFLENIEINN